MKRTKEELLALADDSRGKITCRKGTRDPKFTAFVVNAPDLIEFRYDDLASDEAKEKCRYSNRGFLNPTCTFNLTVDFSAIGPDDFKPEAKVRILKFWAEHPDRRFEDLFWIRRGTTIDDIKTVKNQ